MISVMGYIFDDGYYCDGCVSDESDLGDDAFPIFDSTGDGEGIPCGQECEECGDEWSRCSQKWETKKKDLGRVMSNALSEFLEHEEEWRVGDVDAVHRYFHLFPIDVDLIDEGDVIDLADGGDIEAYRGSLRERINHAASQMASATACNEFIEASMSIGHEYIRHKKPDLSEAVLDDGMRIIGLGDDGVEFWNVNHLDIRKTYLYFWVKSKSEPNMILDVEGKLALAALEEEYGKNIGGDR